MHTLDDLLLGNPLLLQTLTLQAGELVSFFVGKERRVDGRILAELAALCRLIELLL